MPNPTIRIVSTYPTEGEGISLYTHYLIDELRNRSYSIVTTRLYFLNNKLSTVKWIRLLGTRENILHVQYTPTGSGPGVYLYALLRDRKKKFIITSHELPSTYAKHLPGVIRRIFYALEGMLHNTATAITVHTKQHRDELISIGVKPSKVTIIQFPVYPVFKNRTNEKPDSRHGIFFGRITPKKGIEVLFEAIKLLPSDMTFSIIGPPASGFEAYAHYLKERASNMGIANRVRFSGFLDNASVSEAMYNAGFAVFPYNYITQSAALMTSIGHGLPYIASDLPAFKEVHSDYKSGLLFKTGNTESLVHAIESCMDITTHERLVRESAAARARFNWQSYSDVLVEIYDN
jgi:glycosyltransferase involved in cell wall biosynthesis